VVKRIITGTIGLAVFAAVVFWGSHILLNIAISVIVVIAVYEAFIATGFIKSKLLFIGSAAFAAAVPFLRLDLIGQLVLTAYIFFLFVVMLTSGRVIVPQDIGLAFFLTTALSLSFCSMIALRDIYDHPALDLTPGDGLFLLVLAAIGAWGTDAGGYFAGRFLGRHKMAPDISPKKTVEGAIGGVILCELLFLVSGWIYSIYFLKEAGTVSYVVLGGLAVVCALASMIGDLTASAIKRTCGIKDFGNLFPGHGGVLDRFDSMLAVAPIIAIAVQIFPIVVR